MTFVLWLQHSNLRGPRCDVLQYVSQSTPCPDFYKNILFQPLQFSLQMFKCTNVYMVEMMIEFLMINNTTISWTFHITCKTGWPWAMEKIGQQKIFLNYHHFQLSSISLYQKWSDLRTCLCGHWCFLAFQHLTYQSMKIPGQSSISINNFSGVSLHKCTLRIHDEESVSACKTS